MAVPSVLYYQHLTVCLYLETSRIVVLNQAQFCPPGDIWLSHWGSANWNLVGRGNDAVRYFIMYRTASDNKSLTPDVSRAWMEEPCSALSWMQLSSFVLVKVARLVSLWSVSILEFSWWFQPSMWACIRGSSVFNRILFVVAAVVFEMFPCNPSWPPTCYVKLKLTLNSSSPAFPFPVLGWQACTWPHKHLPSKVLWLQMVICKIEVEIPDGSNVSIGDKV